MGYHTQGAYGSNSLELTPLHISQMAARYKAVAREREPSTEPVDQVVTTYCAKEVPLGGPAEDCALESGILAAQLQSLVASDPVGATAFLYSADQLKRQGALLNPTRILKTDQYPGLHKNSLQTEVHKQPRIEGAPNYRALAGSAIRGVAQPTLEGARKVLEMNGAGPGGRECTWINLREEPVIYIKGKPHTLRELNFPLSNLEATGIESDELEAIEARLKQDVIAEIHRTGGTVLLHDESTEMELTRSWVRVNPEDVLTPREAFEGLRQEGYQVRFERVPVTDEKTPEFKDYDQLFGILKDQSPDTVRIINCHAGRGRTTTGMIIADLIEQAIHSPTDLKPLESDLARQHLQDEAGRVNDVNDLAKALESFSAARKPTDLAIERANAVQNLREAVLNRRPPPQGHHGSETKALAARSNQFLERYLLLIQFSQYLQENRANDFQMSFEQWVESRPEIQETIRLATKALSAWHEQEVSRG